MTDEESEEQDELVEAVRGHFLLGLERQLLSAYPNAGTGQVEDAIVEAVKRLVIRMRREPPLDDVRSYLAKVAYNRLTTSAAKAAKREAPLDDHDEAVSSAEDEALRDAAVDAIKAEIRTWENANMREVMLVYVDSIAYGEPLEHTEVASIVSVNLGEEISPGSIRTWKMRGMRRLREFVESAEIVETRRSAGGEESS